MKNILEMFIFICRKHLALLDILHCRQTQMLPLIVLIQRNLSPTMVWDFYSACSVVHIRMYLNNTSSSVFCIIPFHDAISYNTIPTIPYHTYLNDLSSGVQCCQIIGKCRRLCRSSAPLSCTSDECNKQTSGGCNKRNKQTKQANETNKRNK